MICRLGRGAAVSVTLWSLPVGQDRSERLDVMVNHGGYISSDLITAL